MRTIEERGTPRCFAVPTATTRVRRPGRAKSNRLRRRREPALILQGPAPASPEHTEGDQGLVITGTPFAIIPEWLLDAAVTPRAVVLYGLLRRYADKCGHCHPSRKRLAERLRCTDRTITSLLAELVDIGAITVTARYDGDGGRSLNDYILHDTRWPSGVLDLDFHEAPGNQLPDNNESQGFNESSVSKETAAASSAAPVQDLIGHYVDCAQTHGVTPPSTVRNAMGATIKRLLRGGTDPADVRTALRWAAEENKQAAALAGLVMDVQAERAKRAQQAQAS